MGRPVAFALYHGWAIAATATLVTSILFSVTAHNFAESTEDAILAASASLLMFGICSLVIWLWNVAREDRRPQSH